MSLNKTQEWLSSFRTTIDKKIAGRAKTISITGGKGGVGKTSVAVKLGKMWSEAGYKVLLLDCDYNLSNTLVKLSLPIKNDFEDLIAGRKDFKDCLQRHDNLDILSGCNGSLDLYGKNIQIDRLILDVLVEHENEYDLILLDCPAGLSREALSLNAYCDYRVVIATPDRSSLTDCYSLMKILNNVYGVSNNHLLVNKVTSQNQYKRIVKSLSETVENFLSTRLNVVGHLSHEVGEVDQFDRVLFSEKKLKINQDFLKVFERLSDEVTGSIYSSLSAVPLKRSGDLGQDVQITIS